MSRYENLPYSILESLCCRVPNVSFDVGGIKEIISHRTNGWIVKNKNINSICDGINWSIKNHSKLKNICRKSVVNKFNYQLTKKK